MKQLIIISTLFLSSHTLFAQQQQLQAIIKQYGIPGIQLVHVKGDKEESFNLGTISASSDKKVTSTTIFEAASLSKCVFPTLYCVYMTKKFLVLTLLCCIILETITGSTLLTRDMQRSLPEWYCGIQAVCQTGAIVFCRFFLSMRIWVKKN